MKHKLRRFTISSDVDFQVVFNDAAIVSVQPVDAPMRLLKFRFPWEVELDFDFFILTLPFADKQRIID